MAHPCVGVSWAIRLGGSCPKTMLSSEMCSQDTLADLNATGWAVSTGLECFGGDTTASLLELSVQRCLRSSLMLRPPNTFANERALVLLSNPSLWSVSDFLSTQGLVMQVLIIHPSLLQMNHKVNLMKQSTQKEIDI